MGTLLKIFRRWLVVACAVSSSVATHAYAESNSAYAAGEAGTDVARAGQTAQIAETPFARLRYALQVEPALGVVGGGFYNQLAGARIDYRFTRELSLGWYVGYANLKGKEGRAHDVLPYLNLEYRPRLGQNSAFGLPLGFGTGYLPNNGPFLRLAAGLSYAVSPQTDVVIAFFTPTFWVVHDRTVISLGAALEVSYAP